MQFISGCTKVFGSKITRYMVCSYLNSTNQIAAEFWKQLQIAHVLQYISSYLHVAIAKCLMIFL